MASIFKKIKYVLDWLQHGYLLVQILTGIGVGQLLKAVLLMFTRIDKIWITPMWLLGSAITIALLVWIGNKYKKPKLIQSGSQNDATVSIGGSGSTAVPQFNAADFFIKAYHSPFALQVETNIKKAAAENQPNDREGFYIRFIGVGLVGYVYDTLWLSIFRSQLLMLLELNRRSGYMPFDDMKSYYDQAASDNPDFYKGYTFDQWLNFIKSNELVIVHPSKMVEITVKGKDFLKYLLHYGHEPNQRSL